MIKKKTLPELWREYFQTFRTKENMIKKLRNTLKPQTTAEKS